MGLYQNLSTIVDLAYNEKGSIPLEGPDGTSPQKVSALEKLNLIIARDMERFPFPFAIRSYKLDLSPPITSRIDGDATYYI